MGIYRDTGDTIERSM